MAYAAIILCRDLFTFYAAISDWGVLITRHVGLLMTFNIRCHFLTYPINPYLGVGTLKNTLITCAELHLQTLSHSKVMVGSGGR